MSVHPFFKAPARNVKKVFIHCSASDNPKHDNVATITNWHLAKGYREIGYHYFIHADGDISLGRSLEKIPSAQKPFNTGSIAICLHGLTTFTPEQFHALRELCKSIHVALPHATFHGHCEVNKNKTCPVFNYKAVLGLDKNGKLNLV